MKKFILNLWLAIFVFIASSCCSDVPEIEATEKKTVENYLETQTEDADNVSETVDSLNLLKKTYLVEQANSSPNSNKNCDEILLWLEAAVKTYVATGDTIVLDSIIANEQDVIFNSCLSNNVEYREKYNKIMDIWP